MPNPFDHLHIKRRTAGSSNELSFDVLDAARNDADSKRSRNVRIPMGPRITQGGYGGASGGVGPGGVRRQGGMATASTLSAAAEVERRKRARRNHTIRLWILGAVVVVALAAAGVYGGYQLHQTRDSFTLRFNELIGQFVDIDKIMVEVDALMVDPINSVELDERTAILGEFDRIDAALDQVIAGARAMQDDAAAQQDDPVLASVETAALARKDMLVAAADAFKLSEIAIKQVASANQAWNRVLAGDSEAREGTSVSNGATTEAATQTAREKTESAIDSMTRAKEELELLAHEVANVDFSSEIAYIDKRVEALEAGVATTDALLAGNREAAVSENAEYNALDQEAAALASELPPSISDQVKSQYADEMQRLVDAYSAARTQATTSDAAIRSRLGNVSLS